MQFAVRAECAPAAAVAQQDRCEPAPVTKDQGLLPALQVFSDGVEQRRGEGTLQARSPHVQQAHFRKPGAADAPWQSQGLVTSAQTVVRGFQGGCGRSQDHRHPLVARAHHRHVARAVAEALLLLVGGVMFLVYDDDAGVA